MNWKFFVFQHCRLHLKKYKGNIFFKVEEYDTCMIVFFWNRKYVDEDKSENADFISYLIIQIGSIIQQKYWTISTCTDNKIITGERKDHQANVRPFNYRIVFSPLKIYSFFE